MKTHSILGLGAVVFLSLSACSKQETAPPPPAGDMQRAADTAATEANKAADAVQKGLNDTQRAAQDAAADAQAQAQKAQQAADQAAAEAQAQAASLTSKAQTTIELARKQIADGNWAEALKTLNQLAGLKLTPEQQTMVDNLKQQAQKLAQDVTTGKATDAANKAIGNLLKKE